MSESIEDAAARRRAKILSRGADRMNIVLGVKTPTVNKSENVEEKIDKIEEVIEKPNNISVPKEESLVETTPIVLKQEPVSSNSISSPVVASPTSNVEVVNIKNQSVIKPKKSALAIQLQLNRIKYVENILHLFICILIGSIYAFDFEILRFFTEVYTPLRLLLSIEIIFQSTFYFIINNLSSQV